MTEPTRKRPSRRPAKKPAKKPAAPKEPTLAPEEKLTSTFVELFDRVGLGPALLVVGGYLVFTIIVQPLATTYREAIDEVAETNSALRATVQKNNQEDAERVKEIVEQFERVHSRLDEIKSGVDNLSPTLGETINGRQ